MIVNNRVVSTCILCIHNTPKFLLIFLDITMLWGVSVRLFKLSQIFKNFYINRNFQKFYVYIYI